MHMQTTFPNRERRRERISDRVLPWVRCAAVLALLLLIEVQTGACGPNGTRRSIAPAPGGGAPQQAAISPQPATPASTAHAGKDLPTPLDPIRLQRLLARNDDASVSLPESLIAARIALWRGLALGPRIARWADLFAARGDATYLFGLKPGGYVADSLLVQDFKQDCVLFTYRCTELAQSASARAAVILALATRFAGANPDSVVSPAGGVNYDHPSHIDDPLDFVRSGHWGREVTEEVGTAVVDGVGTSLHPGGSFRYIPTARLRLDRLQDGDLVYFVFDERNPRGQKMRSEYGLVIGHQGILSRHGDTVTLIHAAQSDLQGEYHGNRIVRVPLMTYLHRVDSFKGIIVTRLEAPAPAGSR
jgi:hypothetical protein